MTVSAVAAVTVIVAVSAGATVTVVTIVVTRFSGVPFPTVTTATVPTRQKSA